MANSIAAKEIKNVKVNKEDKFCSKSSLEKKYEVFIKKKYSLKSCYVPLQKTDEVHLDNAKLSSQDSNETIVVPCTKSKVHSETSKIKSSDKPKSKETSKDSEKTFSIASVQHKNSASSSVVFDCTSCYVSLEKLAIPINHFSLYSSEKEEIIRNIAMCDSSEHIDRNISPNMEVNNNYKMIHNKSFEIEMPCSESKLIPSVSESNVKESVFNSTEDLDDSMEESFISASNLSTPSSLESGKIQSTNSFFLEIPSVPVISKRTAKENNALFSSTPFKRRRISSSGSDSSKLNACKGTEILVDTQKGVKTNESLSSAHCARKKAKSARRRILSSGSDCSKLDAGKGTETLVDTQKGVKTNENLSSAHCAGKETRSARRRISSFSSDSSKLDAGKGTETLVDNQKGVKTNENLSSAHCAGKEARSARRRISSFSSDSSKLDAGKGTETLVDNQKGIKTNENLSSAHCVGKEARRARRRISSFSSDSSKLDAGKDTEALVGNQKGVKTNENLSSAHCAGKGARRRISSFSSDSSKLDASKGTETLVNQSLDNKKGVKTNENLFSVHCARKEARSARRISSFSSESSKLDAGKGTETLVDNQKSVKTNESLSFIHCARKEAKKSDDLKCMKRTAKLLSFDSGSSTVENYQSAFRKRKGLKAKHECRKCQIKRDFSYCVCNSSSDSDSTVYNSSLETTQSHKQGKSRKNRKIEVPRTSYILRAFNRNVEKNCSMYKEKNTCSKMCDKNKNIFTSKYKSSNSETDANFSDNSLSNVNKKMSEHKRLKHSFRGNCIRTERVHLSHTLKKNVNKCISLKKSSASDISNNSENGQECNMAFKYNLKPCSVFLQDAGKNNITSTGNLFNDFHQKNSPKAVCEIDCLESKSNKQFHFSKRKKMSKSMKCIEKESSDDNKDYKTVKKYTVLTDSDDLPEYKKDPKKCNDYFDTNSIHESQDHGNESHIKESKKKIEEVECHFSDSSNSCLNLDEVYRNSDFLKKAMKSDNKNSSENVSSENCIKTLNSDEVNSIISTKNYSSVIKDEDISEAKVIHDDPDVDEAYFADTDEGSDNPESALKNDNCFSEDICKTCSVNVLKSEMEGINTTKKIPSYLGPKTKSVKNDDRFIFKSKTNGSLYIVDYFEYENIKKMFVTIHWKKGTLLYSNNDSNRNSSPTLSERIEAFGGFNRMDVNTCLRLHATSGRNQHENKQMFPLKENISAFDKGEVLDREKNSEPFNTDLNRPGPNPPSASLSDDTTLSNTSSDISDDNKYDEFCVHCCAKFSSKKDNYNHTCEGKLKKGYLCVYCEIVFSSYSKLHSHRELHSI